jgi:hypothetical protein
MDYQIIEKKAPKVAIVGFAGTKHMAPYDNPDEFEIWGMNDLFEHIPRYTRWFDIHDRYLHNMDNYNTREGQKPYIDRLATLGVPIYMKEDYDIVPTAIRYPYELMVDEFGIPRLGQPHIKDPYFTNSVSFMIALAIYEQFEEIHIYGVDMAALQGGEYQLQRPSCEYYIGIARGRGIPVYLPIESDLLRTRFVYGYEDEKNDAFEAKLRNSIDGMRGRQAEIRRRREADRDVDNQYIGAIQAMEDMFRVWA